MVTSARIRSYLQAERLVWSVSTTVFADQFQNRDVWPAQTIKGHTHCDLSLILSLWISSSRGALISRVGLLRKWVGTDSTAGLKQEPQGFRWAGFLERVLAGSGSFSFCVCLWPLADVCSLSLLGRTSFPDWLQLLRWGMWSSSPNYSSFPSLS